MKELRTHLKYFTRGQSVCGLIGLAPARFSPEATCRRCQTLMALYRRRASEGKR